MLRVKAPRLAFLVAITTVAACASAPIPALPPLPMAAGGATVTYAQVQPILERRCVVCHGCYDAPCQLVLSSDAGLERGARKDVVYQATRLTETRPSRLFIDAQSTAQWRERGFFGVIDTDRAQSAAPLMRSMLELGRAHPLAPNTKLPADFPLDINRTLACPRVAEFGGYVREHPFGGMPYGVAPLSDAEVGTLAAWLNNRKPPAAAPPALRQATTTRVARWEAFLNGDSLKERIMARYLYEHWFVAHLHFDDHPHGPFFRVVRAATPPGEPIVEIATRRPYDAPGTERFWYRLRPLTESILHKTHIVYALSDARMKRLSALFLDVEWQPTRFPSYDVGDASNPFISFDQIPARSRYQFLLDDAQYFVMTFIRGPVCRGQVAVDVIDDHFFVAFLDPDHDLSVIDPGFLEQTKSFLDLPAEHLSHFVPGEFWIQYGVEQRRYLALRERAYDAADPKLLGPTLGFLWDGDGHDSDAQLTVFRNFDNATVVRGFLGAIPKTAWVIDFPIFERIYYNLVAGYDVFGGVAHQVATRLYMDHLRMQAENLFLTFLPSNRREAIRASWYVGATHHRDYAKIDRLRALDHGTQIPFTTNDVNSELLGKILARNPAVSGAPDLLNRCGRPPCDRPGASALERRAERALQPLAAMHGPWVAVLPELALLRVRAERDTQRSAVYTLVHNRAHTNVAFMFGEEARLEPAEDTVTVGRGYLGSYPNFVFDVPGSEIETFTQALVAVQNAADLESLVQRWGVRRTSATFWATIDWLHEDFRRRQPTEFGILDLNRYDNL